MIRYLQTMITCRWAARRLGQYLDADVSAPLAPEELRRLEAHLATCRRCSTVLAEYTSLSRALAAWEGSRAPGPDAVERMQLLLDDLTSEQR